MNIQPTKETQVIHLGEGGSHELVTTIRVSGERATSDQPDVAVFDHLGNLVFPLIAATAASVYTYNLSIMQTTEEKLGAFLAEHKDTLEIGDLLPTYERFLEWDKKTPGKAKVITDVIPCPSGHLGNEKELQGLMRRAGMDPNGRQYRRMTPDETQLLDDHQDDPKLDKFLSAEKFTRARVLRTSDRPCDNNGWVQLLDEGSQSVRHRNSAEYSYCALRSVTAQP